MMTGLTILAVLTFIAIGEIKSVGEPIKGEDRETVWGRPAPRPAETRVD
jgi:hypothetical protein